MLLSSPSLFILVLLVRADRDVDAVGRHDYIVNEGIALNNVVALEFRMLHVPLVSLVGDYLAPDAVTVDSLLPPIEHFPEQTVGAGDVRLDYGEGELLTRH